MRLAFPCSCGGLLVVYDRRKVGNAFQYRAKCVCGESTKVTYAIEGDFVLLRPRRKEALDMLATDAKMECKETQIG